MAWKKRDVMASAEVAISGLVSGSNLMKKRRLLASRITKPGVMPSFFAETTVHFPLVDGTTSGPGTRFNSAIVIRL